MSAAAIKAGKAFVAIEAIDNTARVLRAAQANLSKFAQNVQSLGKRIMTATALIGAPMALSLRSYQQFDDQMRIVKAVSQSTESEFQALTAQAKELGRTTSFTAVEVAALQKELGKAGFSADDMLAMTPHTLDLSRAADVPTDIAAGIVASSLRQFNMEASETQRVADGLTEAANGTFNSVQDIGEALKYAGPIANQFNLSFEETLALVGALGNIGIQGSMAGTVLRNLQLRTAAMPKDFAAIGVATLDAGGNLRNLIDILDDVDKATASMGTGKRAEILNKLFGVRSVTGGAALAGDTGGVRELLSQIQNATGVANKSAKDFDAGIGGAFRRFTSALEGIQIGIGKALEWMGSYLDKGAEILTATTQWIAANQRFVASFALIVGVAMAVGASLVALGVAVKLISAALTPFHLALSLLKPLLILLPNLIGLLFSPLGVLIGLIAGVGYVLFQMTDGWSEAWKSVSSTFLTAWGGIVEKVMSGDLAGASTIAMAGLRGVWADAIAGMHKIWINFKQSVAEAWIGMLNTIQSKTIEVQTNIASILLKWAALDKDKDGTMLARGQLARMLLGVDLREPDRRGKDNPLGIHVGQDGQGGSLADALDANQQIGAQRQEAVDQSTGQTMSALTEDLNREREAANAEADQARAELAALLARPPEEQTNNPAPIPLSGGEQLRQLANGAGIPAMSSIVSKSLPESLERGTVAAAQKAHENKQLSLLSQIASNGIETAEGMENMLDFMKDFAAGFEPT